MTKTFSIVAGVVFLTSVTLLPAQEADSADSAPEDAPVAQSQEDSRGDFVNSLFFTLQYGGGVMLSTGGGLAFFDNVVRPEVLIGYTPSGNLKDFSVNSKLNARVVGFDVSEVVSIYGTLGAAFTYFSSNNRIVSAAFLAQEVDVREVFGVPTFTFYIEENVYFVETTEGNAIFQLAIGGRVSLF